MDNTGKAAYSAKQSRKKYRLNKKKFAGTLTLLLLTAALVCAALVILPKKLAKTEQPDPIETVKIMATVMVQTDVPAVTMPLEGLTIVVDAGHGGFDPGAIGAAGTHEDVLNLAIAERLKAELESGGADVVMTRNDEDALAENKAGDMAQRGIIIRHAEADAVVSIHMNFFEEDTEVCGPLVLFMPGSDGGKELAESIQGSMNTALNSQNTTRSESLDVLKSGSQPSVLVECGFLSNAQEEEKLGQPDYQQSVAESICEGIKAYFS